jgi:hypothetical protein
MNFTVYHTHEFAIVLYNPPDDTKTHPIVTAVTECSRCGQALDFRNYDQSKPYDYGHALKLADEAWPFVQAHRRLCPRQMGKQASLFETPEPAKPKRPANSAPELSADAKKFLEEL